MAACEFSLEISASTDWLFVVEPHLLDLLVDTLFH